MSDFESANSLEMAANNTKVAGGMQRTPDGGWQAIPGYVEQQAKDAIAKGADKTQVKARLKTLGIDPTGVD